MDALNLAIIIFGVAGIAASCTFVSWMIYQTYFEGTAKKLFLRLFPSRISSHTNLAKLQDNFLDITPQYANREGSAAKLVRGLLVSTDKTEEKMSEAAQQALNQISILRQLVNVQKVDKVKTIKSVKDANIVTYQDGKVFTNQIYKQDKVSIPLTLHYYSLPVLDQSYRVPSMYNVTIGWECGMYLATIENCILLQALKHLDNTESLYKIEDPSEVYRANLAFKNKKVDRYSMVLKESCKAFEAEFFGQLFEELGVQPEIHLIYIPDKFMEYFSITSILIELDNIGVCLTEKTPVQVEVLEYPRHRVFAQAIIEIGIAMTGSPNVIVCYDKEDYLVPETAVEFLRSL